MGGSDPHQVRLGRQVSHAAGDADAPAGLVENQPFAIILRALRPGGQFRAGGAQQVWIVVQQGPVLTRAEQLGAGAQVRARARAEIGDADGVVGRHPFGHARGQEAVAGGPVRRLAQGKPLR